MSFASLLILYSFHSRHISFTSNMNGASYEEYTKLFNFESVPLKENVIYEHLGFLTIILSIVAFFSLSLALLVNIKNKSHVSYVLNAIVASLSIGMGSILVSNYAGVYI